MRTIGQKYLLQGVTGFNQVVIKLQLVLEIAFCDYGEEKKLKHTAPVFYRVDALRASRGKRWRLVHLPIIRSVRNP